MRDLQAGGGGAPDRPRPSAPSPAPAPAQADGWDESAYRVAEGFEEASTAAAAPAAGATEPHDVDHLAPYGGAGQTHDGMPLSAEPEPADPLGEEHPYFVANLISGTSDTHNKLQVVSWRALKLRHWCVGIEVHAFCARAGKSAARSRG